MSEAGDRYATLPIVFDLSSFYSCQIGMLMRTPSAASTSGLNQRPPCLSFADAIPEETTTLLLTTARPQILHLPQPLPHLRPRYPWRIRIQQRATTPGYPLLGRLAAESSKARTPPQPPLQRQRNRPPLSLIRETAWSSRYGSFASWKP